MTFSTVQVYKRKLLMCLVVVMLVVISGCGDNPVEKEETIADGVTLQSNGTQQEYIIKNLAYPMPFENGYIKLYKVIVQNGMPARRYSIQCEVVIDVTNLSENEALWFRDDFFNKKLDAELVVKMGDESYSGQLLNDEGSVNASIDERYGKSVLVAYYYVYDLPQEYNEEDEIVFSLSPSSASKDNESETVMQRYSWHYSEE